jgi:hypothetical protein
MNRIIRHAGHLYREVKTADAVPAEDPVEFMEQLGENYAKDLARQGLRPSTGGQQMDTDSFNAFENHFDREMTDEEHDAWFTGFNRAAQRLFKNRHK